MPSSTALLHSAKHSSVKNQNPLVSGTTKSSLEGPVVDKLQKFRAAESIVSTVSTGKNFGRLAIRRMARRGGVKRISAKIYPDVRECAINFLDSVLGDAMTYQVHAKRGTVKAQDVVKSLRRQGHNLLGYGGQSR